MLDWVLAIAHHLLAFTLVAQLFAEWTLTRKGMDAGRVRQVANIDLGYGIVAGLLLAVGIARLVFAAKGWSWYQSNPWFWAKMAAFLAVALSSIPPTVRYIGWSRRLKAEAGWTPSDPEIGGVRMWLGLELVLIAVILVCAAAMARFQGSPFS